ncbi:MAG: MFS transporter [Sandaracinaceae bacterium]
MARSLIRAFGDAFASPRLALMVGLGFAAGLPNPLVGDTLSAWLYSHHVSLTAIGLLGFVHLPYNLKFLWAPLFDGVTLPFLSRRRAWIVVWQIALLIAIGVLGTIDPSTATYAAAGVALFIGFAAASQDIVVDAYRTELLPESMRASGTAIFVAAYRAALIVSGAGALFLADRLPWSVVFLILGGLMSVGVITTLIAPPPEGTPPPPRTFKAAVVDPLLEFLRRRGAWSFLAIVALYKFGDVVVSQLRSPFLLSLGFSLTDIGAIGKGLGMVSTIFGALIGGGLVAAWGLRRSMIVFGIAQALPNLTYAGLAYVGHDYGLMAAGIAIDNFMGGLGASALTAFLMMLCDRRYTAFQFALLTSLMTVPGRLFGLAAGWLTEQLGWETMWVISVLVALPAIVLLALVEFPPEPSAPTPSSEGTA